MFIMPFGSQEASSFPGDLGSGGHGKQGGFPAASSPENESAEV
jgi:hypothetical protein